MVDSRWPDRGTEPRQTTNDERPATNRRGFLSTPTTQPPTSSDWEIHSHQDKELVKGLGLTSATMLVMGSMIGSGIFIVSAEIGREVDSPALVDRSLGRRWIHDHCGRAQLWRTSRHDAAGRRPIRLSARSARAALGISLRLDTFPGDSDRNHRRGRRGFRQVPRRLLFLQSLPHTGCSTCGRFHRFMSAPWCWATWTLASIPRI